MQAIRTDRRCQRVASTLALACAGAISAVMATTAQSLPLPTQQGDDSFVGCNYNGTDYMPGDVVRVTGGTVLRCVAGPSGNYFDIVSSSRS